MRKTLIDYIKKNIKKGYTVETLKIALTRQSYPLSTIELAIKKAQEELAEEVPKIEEKPKIKYIVYDNRNKPVQIKKKKSFWKKFNK